MKRMLRAQDGMEAPQEQPQGGGQDQMAQMVAQVQQMLQQAPPEQVIAQLLQKMGDPNMVVQIMSAATQQAPEAIMPMVQQVAQQMQQPQGEGQPQGQEQQQEAPQGQPIEQQAPAEAPMDAPMALGGATHMMPDGTMMDDSQMGGNPFEGLFGRRYGQNDWQDPQFHPGADPNPTGVGGIDRNIHDARQLARTINKRIRTDFVGSDGMPYNQFSKVHGRDFVVKDELGSFGHGGEFDSIRKDMLKTFAGGGPTDKELDSTDTESYIASLKNALQSHMFQGYAKNKINADFKAIANQAGIPIGEEMGIPKAYDGQQTQKRYDEGRYYEGHGPGQQPDPYGYQREKYSMSPLARMLGSVSRNEGAMMARGFGELEGKSFEDFRKEALNREVGTDYIYKENIFGKEKRHTNRNIIGARFTLGDYLSSGTNPLAETLKKYNVSQADYDANTGNIKGAIDAEMKNNPVGTGLNPISPAQGSPDTQSNLSNALGAPTDRGRLAYYGDDKWEDKQKREQDTDPVVQATNATNTGPLVGTEGYGVGANQQASTGLDRQEALFNQVRTNLGFPADFDPWKLPDSDPKKQQFLDMADELEQRACGGSTHSKMMKAQNGMELQKARDTFSFNPSEFAYGIEGMGQKFSGFLDKMNAYQSAQDMAYNRSPDAMFKPSPSHSGDEGIYWANLQRQMGQDMGADVLVGTGSDWGGFRSNKGQSFKGDFFQQQNPFANGGVAGMNAGGDLILNDDQIKKLESIGYSLKRKF